MNVLAERSQTLELDVRRRYADFSLDVAATIPLEGVTGLFGASGSGKSTVLRIIAGLERADEGSVSCAGVSWFDGGGRRFLPPHRRPVGYVFQDARLFVHLSVAGNLRYAARRSDGAANGPRYAEVVDACDLEPLLDRKVERLSGGEKQRVALGRTLLTQPRLLLLDEPLAALDARRKQDILPYLETLHQQFGIPTLYVSHSLDEIVRLADRVIVLQDGRVHSHGATAPVLNALALPSARSRFDIVSILEARIVGVRPELQLAELEYHGQPIFVPDIPRGQGGDIVRLQVHAADVALATSRPQNLSVRNVLRGTVERIDTDPASAFAAVTVTLEGGRIRSQLTRQAVTDLALVPGMTVYALLKTAAVHGTGY